MRKVNVLCFALVLVVGLCGVAGAQFNFENHYLVYDIDLTDPVTVPINVTLWDQFNQWFPVYSTNSLTLEKFANPVQKNGEDYFEPLFHQTWWGIDDPQPNKEVTFSNQFGLNQTWDVGDGRYLVLPAWKDEIPPGGQEFPYWNHYKCYEAVGDPVNVEVGLDDQWGGFVTVAVDPVLFCNPCNKETDEFYYQIEEPVAHLAVYTLESPFQAWATGRAFDQFGVWDIDPEFAIWLVLPSDKHTVVDNETKTWGGVKSLYR